MLRDVVPAVHEVVGHDVEEVQVGLEVYDIAAECNHVALDAGDCGGDQTERAQGGAKFTEQERVGVDFPRLLRVWNLLVVLAVPAGVLPIDVDA